jgi:hypothetical protein
MTEKENPIKKALILAESEISFLRVLTISFHFRDFTTIAMPLKNRAQRRSRGLIVKKIARRDDISILVKINIKSRIPIMLKNFTLIFIDCLIFLIKSYYAFSSLIFSNCRITFLNCVKVIRINQDLSHLF